MTSSIPHPAALASEHIRADWRDLDLLDTEDQLRVFDEADALIPTAVAAARPALAKVVEAVTERVAAGGRLVYLGAGSAGRVAAQDAAEVAPTFGIRPGQVIAVVAGGAAALVDARESLEDDESVAVSDLVAAGVSARDALVGVSASGRTPYVLAGVRWARARGALTVGFTANRGSPLAAISELKLEVSTGPEVLVGATRLKAGTAQKVVLNRLSSLVMVRLGHTYGNLLLGASPDNAKLRARARRLLAEVSGAGPVRVDIVLAEADDDARVALAMLLADCDARTARDSLAAAAGRIRAAVAAVNDAKR